MGKERRRESKESEKRHNRDGEQERRERERERDGDHREKKERSNQNGRDEQHSKSSSRRDRDRERESRDSREEHKSRREPREDSREAERAKEEPSNKEEKEQELPETKDSTREIEERISRMREARMKEKASSRRKGDDVRSWVDKVRKMGKEKEKEKKAACKPIAEQDDDDVAEDDDETGYRSKDLAGLKIRHGLDKIMEGGAVVLTLKDTNIIAGDDLNEEADELENIVLMEQKKREEAYQAAKKKPGLYEDKFQNDINSVKTVLPQYDEATKDEGIELDESGGINEDSRNKIEQVRLRLQGAALKVETLLGPANKASDYYTEEEMLKFKKPKKVKKIRKKPTSTIDVDALEAEAEAGGSSEQDHGTRSIVSKAKQEVQAENEARKQKTYESAFARALEESKALREEKMEIDAPEEAVNEEEDELFGRLKKSREQAMKERAKAPIGAQGIAALLKQNSAAARANEEASSGRTVVITETEEFCLSLQPDEAISKRAANDVFDVDDEDEKPGMEIDDEEQPEVTPVEKKEAARDEDEDDEDEAPIKEVAVGKGLAGALQLLKERGSLKESVEWGGRNMDKKASKLVGVLDDEKYIQREINLDRRDEYGRTMTPKEAFRVLSHKFHGKRPGKTKQEKKMKQHEEELKQKQMASGDTPLHSMEKLREAQAKTNSPYIVVTGHIKPGQISDPRSGFATVEKEPVGSLTPMLGDKKGESLKRRAGDMGPPPARKKSKA